MSCGGWLTGMSCLEGIQSFKRALKKRKGMQAESLEMYFPMYLVPGYVMMNIGPKLYPFEHMLKHGQLIKWRRNHQRTVVFVSHQWLSKHHPDPECKQLSVLQEALRNMAAGLLKPRRDAISDVLRLALPAPDKDDLLSCLEWDFWYDYMCCPQKASRSQVTCPGMGTDLEGAIRSIPSYVDVADHVLVLVPSLYHFDTGEVIGQCSWNSRGWCRAERIAGVCSRRPKSLLTLTSACSLLISGGPEWVSAWPREGKVTVGEDCFVLQKLTSGLLRLKCDSLMQRGDLHGWRFYQALMPKAGGCGILEEDTSAFMERYKMDGLSTSQLEGGLSPLMLASIEGNLRIMRQLINAKANVDAQLHWRLQEAHIEGKIITALSLAAALSTPEAVVTLLDAKASTDLPIGLSGSSVLATACYFGNSDTVQVLIERKCPVNQRTNLGSVALHASTRTSSIECTRILLENRADPQRYNYVGSTPLSFAIMFSQDVGHVQLLLDARADPMALGEPANIFLKAPLWLCKQRVKRGNASHLYWNLAIMSSGGHHLHLAALNGSVEIAQILLDRRADPLVTWEGLTPARIAELHGYTMLTELLRTAEKTNRVHGS